MGERNADTTRHILYILLRKGHLLASAHNTPHVAVLSALTHPLLTIQLAHYLAAALSIRVRI